MGMKQNYLKEFSSILHEYSRKNYLCDVHISVGDSFLTAHSLILSVVSPKLKSVFEKFDPKQSKIYNNTFKLLADDCSKSCLECILQYIYTGAIEVLPDVTGTTRQKIVRRDEEGPMNHSELMKAMQKLGIEDEKFIKNLTVAFTNYLKGSQVAVNRLSKHVTNESNVTGDHNYTNNRKVTNNITPRNSYSETSSTSNGDNNGGVSLDNLNDNDVIHVNVITSDVLPPQPFPTNNASKMYLRSFLANKNNKNSAKNYIDDDGGGDDSDLNSSSVSREMIKDKNERNVNENCKGKSSKKSKQSPNLTNKASNNLNLDNPPNSFSRKLKLLLEEGAPDQTGLKETPPVKNENDNAGMLKKSKLSESFSSSAQNNYDKNAENRPKFELTGAKSNLLVKQSLQGDSSASKINLISETNSKEGTGEGKEKNKADLNLVCDTCGSSFNSHVLYTQHKREHNNPKRYACDVCGKAFSRRYAVCEHKRLHNGERPFQCDRCGKRFTFASDLTKHRRSLHGTVKPYKCAECGKEMSTGREVADHKRLHQGGNTCPLCGKTFTRLHNMKEHIRGTHQGFKPFPCPYCDKRFVYSGSLRLHKRQHKLSVPATSHSTFRSSFESTSKAAAAPPSVVDDKESNLTKNLSVGTTEPVKCDQCGITFTRLLDLIIHDKVYHTLNMGSAKRTQTTPKNENVEVSNDPKLSTDKLVPNMYFNPKKHTAVQLPTNNVGKTSEEDNSNIAKSNVDGLLNSSLTFPMYILFNPIPDFVEGSTGNENIAASLNVLSSESQNIGTGTADSLQELSLSDFINLTN